jgi:Response regulator containing CheY-like receiver, AAA-type ATPase, and DNA-binding domains
MVGSDHNAAVATSDRGIERARTIIVAGQSSRRTREVLRTLRGFTNVIWPPSLEAALEQTGSEDVACLVIADDLREESLDEFLREARELHRNLPIFVITDPDDVAEAVSAMRHGATAVIEIPPSYAALREEVARAVQ